MLITAPMRGVSGTSLAPGSVIAQRFSLYRDLTVEKTSLFRRRLPSSARELPAQWNDYWS
jgi:hypothetical protein